MFKRSKTLWTAWKILVATSRDGTLKVARPGEPVRELPSPLRLRPAAKLASVFMDLATAASRERHHPQAIALLGEAEHLFESVHASPGRNRWVAEILLRRGEELRLAGRYGDSQEALTRAGRLAEDDPGNPLRLAAVVNAQGILAKDTGRYDDALAHYGFARILMEADFGQDDPALAAVHHNLAGLLCAQRRYAEAEEPARHAVALRKRSPSPDPEGLAADLSVLGSILLGLGRLDEAEHLYLQSKNVWTERYGLEHYEVAAQLNGLASVHQARGEFESAERDFKEALRLKQKCLGAGHRETAVLLNNLGALEMDRGHTDAAAPLYEWALLTFRNALGDDHPDTVLCAENLVRVSRQTGSWAGAKSDMDSVPPLCRDHSGAEIPDALTNRNPQ